MTERVCRVCGEAKPQDAFGADRSRRDGLMTRCKICNNEHSRKWQLENRERYRERLRNWRLANADKKRAKDRAYSVANREQIAARERDRLARQSDAEREARMARARVSNQLYAARNRAQIAEKNRLWHAQRDAEERRAKTREWKARNPEKVAADNRQRRIVDPDDAVMVSVLRRDPCAYCGGTAGEVDHIVPLSAGGGLGWDNLTAACRSCNARKSRRSLVRFLAYDSLLGDV